MRKIKVFFLKILTKSIFDSLDTKNRINGAIFLGLEGIVIKSHGYCNKNELITVLNLAFSTIKVKKEITDSIYKEITEKTT